MRRSGMGSHGHPLARRLERLERRQRVDRSAEWPAFLADYFAEPEYDGHREAIIAALTGEEPRYTFDTTTDKGQEATYLIWWWSRDDGGRELTPPTVMMVVEVEPSRAEPPGANEGGADDDGTAGG
jgi:hypothetical protein